MNRIWELDQSDDLWQEKLWAILDHVPRDRSGCIEMAELVWACSLEEVWWTLFFDFWGFLTADERHYYIAEGDHALRQADSAGVASRNKYL